MKPKGCSPADRVVDLNCDKEGRRASFFGMSSSASPATEYEGLRDRRCRDGRGGGVVVVVIATVVVEIVPAQVRVHLARSVMAVVLVIRMHVHQRGA